MAAKKSRPRSKRKVTPAKKAKVAKTMREYKQGKLHSGSKKGPRVKSRKQAIAIALGQAGLSRKKRIAKGNIHEA
jgi:hypothetical protein